MINHDIAQIFRDIALMLELKGENPFRIRAYERAAQTLEGLNRDVDSLMKEQPLTDLPGIGKDLAAKIEEYIQKKSISYHAELSRQIPEGVLAMMAIPGLGPKTVKAIYEKLNITTIEKLKQATEAGALRALGGVKEKTEENILKGIELLKKGKERTPLYTAKSIADSVVSALKRMALVTAIEPAGSLRRRKETVRDIDILIVSAKPAKVMDAFTALSDVRQIQAKGETKSSVRMGEDNIQVDVRVVAKESFGSALVYFTGSKQFNIALRQLALKEGFTINEYGVFPLKRAKDKRKNTKAIAQKTEKEVFNALGLDYIAPELRECRGEIEAAQKKTLPLLIARKDIRGDFHVHSAYSDGTSSIEDIALSAQRLGYEYIVIADHSQSLKVASGLDAAAVRKKRKEIDAVNARLKKIRVLCGTEVDILSDGSLDYSPNILELFDVVVAAIHSGFKQSKAQLTKRIVAACKNKYVNIIAHPTGRLWGAREAYELGMAEVFKAARDTNTALEINCFPQRLDLNDTHAFGAREAGVLLALGTDSHRLEHLLFIELGIDVARRGWLTKKDVINCFSTKELMKWLKR